jgi:ATP-dependent exoDNAse (exonuclease V) beta subunit
MTRARDHLLVGLYRTAKERRPYSLASLLHAAMGDGEVVGNPECVARQLPVELAGGSLTALAVSQRLSDTKVRRDAVLSSAIRSVQLSATKIAQSVSNADLVLPVRTAGNAEQVDDLSHRLTLGSAVHKVLEILAFNASSEELGRTVALVAVEFELEGCEATITDAVAKALCSAPVQEAAAARRHWREVSVAKQVDGVIVRGTIDLLYERGDGLVVVDYKTESVPTEQAIHDAVERYRYQLFTYATALQQEGVGQVLEVVLLFIPPGLGEATVVTLSAEDAMPALRRVLPSIE